MGSTTYGRHKLISASNSGHLVLEEQPLDESLHRLVPLHEYRVAHVDAEQDQRLPPVNFVITKEVDQRAQADAVERAVAEQRPPRQRQQRFREERAHADDEQDVEDGGADDRADADVVERHEHTDDAGEQLGRTAAGRHERGAGHIVRDAQLLDDHVQRRHKELVAHDGQRHEHVHHAEYVKCDGAGPALLEREQVGGEQRILHRQRLIGSCAIRDGGVGTQRNESNIHYKRDDTRHPTGNVTESIYTSQPSFSTHYTVYMYMCVSQVS